MKNTFSKIWGFIAKTIASVNRKYDNMEEPKRFYTALAVGFAPWIILDAFALIFNHKGFDVFALLWVLFIIGIRMWWKIGNLDDYSNG